MEPVNLKHWRFCGSAGNDAYFYTCARPGRSQGQDDSVPETLISNWVTGLPSLANVVVISLLGRKRNRRMLSEFSYYPFYGKWDIGEERGEKPSFQEWLCVQHPDCDIQIQEHPTYDYDRRCIPLATLAAVERDIREFTYAGRTVIVMDSGGVGRTHQVCVHLKATQVSLNQ